MDAALDHIGQEVDIMVIPLTSSLPVVGVQPKISVALPPTAPVPDPAPVIPPAEDWVRAPLLQVDFTADRPVTKDILLAAGSARSMRDPKDARALLTDFRALGPAPLGAGNAAQAYSDALRAASAFSKQLNNSFAWLKNPAVGVMRGRDAWYWAVPVRQGDGTQPIDGEHSRVPSLDAHTGAAFAVTQWQEDVVAVVSGDAYIDTRRDVNGRSGSLEPQAVPAMSTRNSPADA